MGIFKRNNLSLFLISAAMAAELKCYKTTEPSDEEVETCDGTKKDFCYTFQTTYNNGTTEYDRGCYQEETPVQEGCIVAIADGKEGSICFESCNTDKCNNQKNLNSSAPLATGSLLAALFYMLM